MSKSNGLLYLSDSESKVYVYSYPEGGLVDTITGLDAPTGECVDKSGDVWVTLLGADQIVKYTHGGTQSVATLDDPGEPFGCAVDPSTGNLAVSNASGTIEVYTNAEGNPTTYSSPDFPMYYYCTYDGSGDLFADGGETWGMIAELPYGGSALRTIALAKNIRTLSMQWDGADIAIVGPVVGHIRNKGHGAKLGPLQLSRVSVSGSVGRIVSESLLKSPGGKGGGRHVPEPVQFWISGKTIIGPGYYPHGSQGTLTWRYPSGGRPIHHIRALSEPWGTALSLAKGRDFH